MAPAISITAISDSMSENPALLDELNFAKAIHRDHFFNAAFLYFDRGARRRVEHRPWVFTGELPMHAAVGPELERRRGREGPARGQPPHRTVVVRTRHGLVVVRGVLPLGVAAAIGRAVVRCRAARRSDQLHDAVLTRRRAVEANAHR